MPFLERLSAFGASKQKGDKTKRQNITQLNFASHIMHTFAVLSTIVAAVAPSVLAAQAYIPYAWNNTAPEIHGKPVNAWTKRFWINHSPYPSCPSWDPAPCASYNKTIITGPIGQTMWMGILEEHGQQIYTDSVDAGLDYQAIGGSVGTTDVLDYVPFEVEVDDFSNQTVLRFMGNDFVACPEGDIYGAPNAMRVRALSYGGLAYAQQTGPCFPFKMMLVPTDAPAVNSY